MITISYDSISYLISSSVYRIPSVTSEVVQFIALPNTHAHKPVLILVICFTYRVSTAHNVLSHITCVFSLPESDSSLLYALTVSLKSVSIEDSSHVYKTNFPASPQIVN